MKARTDSLFWTIILLKLSAAVSAYYIYAKFSPFIDASIFLSPPYNFYSNVPRTEHAVLIFSTFKLIFHFDLLVYLVTSFSVGYILWWVVRSYYDWVNKPIFYAVLLMPHFLIWSSVVSKEALAIIGYLLLISVFLNWLSKERASMFALGFGLYFASFHPHYLLAYGYLGVVTWGLSLDRFNHKYPIKWLVILLLGLLCGAGLVLFCLWDQLTVPITQKMLEIKAMFLNQFGQTRMNRLDIIWSEPIDFLKNFGWGLPVGIIGPTLKEALQRPILFPVLLEGCIALGLMVYLFYCMVRLAITHENTAAVLILGFIPAVMIGLIINYPVSIFNPGSAVRYKQSLVPLLYFYPILLMATIKRGACENH